MKSKKKGMVVVQLNIDVIAEILSRLRVKDVIRFKSVCKAWLQLISSQEFIQLHLKRSRLRPVSLQTLEFDIDCCSADHLDGMNVLSGISSDGLVCLFTTSNGTIHIWNPAVRSSACIPMKTRPPPIQCFWFGLHNGEYKLLLGTLALEIHVVRPYIDSCYDWQSTRKLQNRGITLEGVGTLYNGSVHWPVSKGQFDDDDDDDDDISRFRMVCTIMSYDLHQGKMGEILMPVDVLCLRLGILDGCLSAVVGVGVGGDCKGIELWVMKNYGYKESWTKLIVFDSGSAISINPEEKVLDDPEMIKSPRYGKDVYIESLIYPPNGSHKESCQIRQIL